MPIATMETRSIPRHEQSELDEILRELLGDTHNLTGGSNSSSRRQGSSSTNAQSSRGKTSSADGNGWLEQQQRKLSQRQLSRDQEDISQLHRQQKQVVSELKNIQTLRKESLTDDFNSNSLYRTEQVLPINAQEPSAYTVFIKPDEHKSPAQDAITSVSQKSLTNVSHNHHTHYNFHDHGDDDQKRRILQLEDELRKVKEGLEQQPPPRPQRLEFDDEEDEEYLFKPVGIASLESGTGQSTLQTHTLQSQQSGYSISNAASPPPHLSGTAGRQQRRILEEQRGHQQHVYQQQPSAGSSQIGTLPSQSSLSQLTRQQSTTAQHITSSSFGFTNDNTANSATSPTTSGTRAMLSASGTRAMPFDQALHINTNDAPTNNSGITYTTIVGTVSPGRVQFINEDLRSMQEPEPSQMTAKFVKDTSKYWYKPHIVREEVISLLKNSTPGTFIVRDSNSFPGAFGLAVKVAQLPPNVQTKPGSSDPAADYVRFYLIEPTTKGVKLKGCTNEPVFASLASLIYQHTITPLALPCKLLLPDPDQYEFAESARHVSSASGRDELDGPVLDSLGMLNGSENLSTAADLLKRGAACNVVYMNNVDTEALTGPQAISRAVHHTFSKDVLETTIATIKVSADGITITDNHRKIFFRQHFPKDSISYCGIDPADRRFTQNLENTAIREAKIFGFVARKKGGNQCLLFAELELEQPASAIVNFVSKVLLGQKG